jgi:RNA polymerase subunit RPABC4/transcription elongation factor Spt4
MKMWLLQLVFCRNCGNAISPHNTQSCPRCGVPTDWAPTIPTNDTSKSQQNKNKKKKGAFRVFIEVIAFFAGVIAIITAIGHVSREGECKDRSIDLDRLLVELKSPPTVNTNLNNSIFETADKGPTYSEYNDIVAEYNKDCLDYREFIQQTKTQ